MLTGSENINLNLRGDLPGSENLKRYRISTELEVHSDKFDCNCAMGCLDFLGKEWGPPPNCLLNIRHTLFKPEVYKMLASCLPKATASVATSPAGAHLSAEISYLLYLIRQGKGFMDEATEQILSFIGQERINCVFGKQLAEDHLANMDLLLRKAEAALRVGMERAGFAAPGAREVARQFVGEQVVYMMHPPDAKEIISFNRLQCQHGGKLLDCKTADHNKNVPEGVADETGKTMSKAAPKKVVIPDFPARDIRDNPDALKNIRSVETVFIAGDTVAEMKEELESQFQDISLTASVHKAEQLEQMPEVLKRIVEGRPPNNCATVRVVLIPLRSSKQTLNETTTSSLEVVLDCMKILDKYCEEKHRSKLGRTHQHRCMVEIAFPPKVPAYNAPVNLIAQVKDKNAVAQLEHEAQRQKTIHTALARFKQGGRLYVHEPKKACYLDVKDPNHLRNFKTSSGARGTLENITELKYMEGNLRRAFSTFIVNAANIKHSEAFPPLNYVFTLANGLVALPEPEIDEPKKKRPRSTSRSRNWRGNNRRHEDSDRDEEDLRDKIHSKKRNNYYKR